MNSLIINYYCVTRVQWLKINLSELYDAFKCHTL